MFYILVIAAEFLLWFIATALLIRHNNRKE